MNTIVSSLAVGAVGLTIGFSVTGTTLDLTNPKPRSLVVNTLAYNNDGTVTQNLSGGLPADWVARIVRRENGVDRILCSGRGDAQGIYTGEDSTYTATVWAGSDLLGKSCPPLIDGDTGKASWTYRNDQGLLVTVSACFRVGAESCSG